MKILHAVSGWPPERSGAIELYVQRLARAQSGAGHEVVVAAGSPSGRFQRGFTPVTDAGEGVAVHRISQPGGLDRWDQGSSPSVARCFGALLESAEPEIVHVHRWSGLSRALVRRAARSRIPSVVTLHDFSASCPRLDRAREREAFCERPLSVNSCLHCVPREAWGTDRVITERIGQYTADMLGELQAAAALLVASAAQGREVARFCGLSSRRLQVIGLPPCFEPGERLGGGWTPDLGRPLRLAIWGPLGMHSGVRSLVEALNRLGRPAEMELVVLGPAGEGALELELEALGSKFSVQRRQACDLSSLREVEADLGLICGLSFEGHGNALDEAVALGLPVLVSDRGALAERIGQGGLAFPPGDAHALAGLLGRMLDEPKLLGSLRAGLPELLGMKTHLADLNAVYKRAIKSGPRRTPAAAGEMDDRERWERLARALEDDGRDLAGVQRSSEGEVRGLRRDVSEVFGRLHEELAKGSGRVSDVRALKTRIAARMSDLRALEFRIEEINRQHEEREDRSREQLERKDNEVVLLRAQERALTSRVEALEARVQLMRREAILALPLILPVRGVMWLLHRLKGRARSDRQGEDAP